MKKTAILILSFLFLSLMTVVFTSAEKDSTKFHVSYNDCEITIERANLSDEQLSIIAAELTSATSDSNPSSRGLTCSLFGHELESTMAVKTIHKKYSETPRCITETYKVSICTRCDESTTTLIATTRIYCCPAD